MEARSMLMMMMVLVVKYFQYLNWILINFCCLYVLLSIKTRRNLGNGKREIKLYVVLNLQFLMIFIKWQVNLFNYRWVLSSINNTTNNKEVLYYVFLLDQYIICHYCPSIQIYIYLNNKIKR